MLLSAQRVSYTYQRQFGLPPVHAVRDISLGVGRGSITGLLGPNGCGKTTLLHLLAGVIRPTSGMVALDGRDLQTMTRRAIARRVAIVPQETHPVFDYTVLDMVLMGRHPHLGPFALEGPSDLALAVEALGATGTEHLADRTYMTLSGGEKQRVVIASALAQAGEVLLLDEPTASLDLGHQLDVAALLRRLTRERSATMVLATHDLNLAASLCDALVLLREGRVLASGPTAEVLTARAVQQVYDVTADVQLDRAAGHLMVVPRGRAR